MEQDRNISLKWNGHQQTLLSVFGSLFHNGTLVDCTLSAEGKQFKAHKVILSACSPYFEMLFSQHHDIHPIVILPDVKFQVLMVLMEFLYSGEVSVPEDIVSDVFNLADILQIKGLYGTRYSSRGEKTRKKRKISTMHTEEPVVVSNAQNSEERFNLCKKFVDAPSILLQNDDSSVRSIEVGSLKREKDVTLVYKEILVDKPSICTDRNSKEAFRLEENEVLSDDILPVSNCAAEVFCNTNSSVDKQSHLFDSANENNSSHFLTTDSSSKKNCSDSVPPSLYQEMKSQEPTLQEFVTVKYEENSNNFSDDSVEVITLDDENDYHFIGCSTDSGTFSRRDRMISENVDDPNFDSLQQDLHFTHLTQPVFRPFECSACGKAYRQHHNLIRHVKYECGKEPHFRCFICPARYTRNEKLKAHIQTVHCSI